MKLTIVGAVAGALLVAGSASAMVLDFNFSNGTDSASGQFTTGPGSYPLAIIGITGTFDGSPITGLSGYAGSDNTLYQPTPLYFSLAGVSFSSVGGDYNIYAYNGGDYLLKSSVDPVGYPANGQVLTTAMVSVPEPATWSLMLLGVFGLGGALRRGRQARFA